MSEAPGATKFVGRDLSLAEFAGVYFYVYTVLYGRMWKGNLNESSMLKEYERHKHLNKNARGCMDRPNIKGHLHQLCGTDHEHGVPLWMIAVERLGIDLTEKS